MKKLSSVKKRLWKLVSEYVRRSEADENGICACVTCGKKAPWKEMDAGHFSGGHKNYNHYDLRNIHCQDSYCNRFMHGNLIPYYKFMLEKYGQEVIDELTTYREVIFTIPQLEALCEQFKEKLRKL